MTLYAIKPRFQATLRALAGRLTGWGVSADALTACGLLAAALAGATLAGAGRRWWLLLVPPLLFIRIACNALDGMVARLAGTARPRGTVLNEAADRAADLLCFGGLVASGALPRPVELALLPLLLLVSYLGVIGQAAGGARRYEGPLGKADRMLALGLYCALAPVAPAAGTVAGWALILGLVLTAFNRLRALAGDAALAGPGRSPRSANCGGERVTGAG